MRFRLNMMLLAILFAGCASTNATREDRHSEQTPDVKGVASFIIDGTSEILLVGDVGLEKGNWMKSYHTAMSELGRSFDACKSDVLLSKDAPVKLTDYKYVLWTCGDARQNTLTPQERKILIHYLDSEGRLFICGSGIGADLAANDGADFYRDFLKSYYDEKTTPINTNGTGLVAATDNSFFKDLQGRVGKGLLGRIEPYGGSESVLFYDGMGEETAAAIAYVGGFSNAKIFGRLVFMGIAWEDIQTSADRTKILDASLQYLEKAGPIRFWAVMQGSVHDAESGEPIEGAEIVVKGLTTYSGYPIRTRSDADGNFKLLAMMGYYHFAVNKEGYQEAVLRNVVVKKQNNESLNITLKKQ